MPDVVAMQPFHGLALASDGSGWIIVAPRLRARARHFLDHATGDQLRVLLQQQQRESQLLRDLMRDDLPRLKAEELRQRLEEQDTVLLSLREERLRLRDQLNMRKDYR